MFVDCLLSPNTQTIENCCGEKCFGGLENMVNSVVKVQIYFAILTKNSSFVESKQWKMLLRPQLNISSKLYYQA